MDISPSDEDAMIRTVMGEAANEPPAGQAAVAHVILNRLATGDYGNTPSKIVKEPGQFEPWQTRRGELEGYKPSSLAYQNTKSIVEGVLDGAIQDPTGGATHFYAPVAQQQLGRPPPQWATDSPQLAQIGGHRFYAPQGPVMADQEDLLGKWNAIPSSAAQPDTKASAQDNDLLSQWSASVSPASDKGKGQSITIPRKPFPGEKVEPKKDDADETVPQWVNRELAAHQDSTVADTAARVGLGALRGVGDVADTLATGITNVGKYGADVAANAGIISPQTAETVGKWAGNTQANIATDMGGFDKAAADNPSASTGRILGQIAGTGPFIEAAPLGGLAGAGPVTQALGRGAVAGAGAAGLTSAASDEPLGEQVATGALAGGVLGPAGVGASAAGRGLRNLILGSVDPETSRLAAAAQAHGIPITAGQISSSPSVRFLDSVLQRLPLSGYGSRTAAQQTGLNRAVAQEMGVQADKVTPDVIDQARKGAYAEYDAAKANMGGNLHLDGKFYNDLSNVQQNAHYVLEGNLPGKIDNLISGVFDKIDTNNHTLDADVYQSLTRKNGPLDTAINSRDSKISTFASDIKEALEGIVGRNDPAMKALKDKADYKYFVAKSLEPLANKSTTGDVSPATLLNAVKNSQTGVGELGRISKRFMQEPPSSGTAERLLTMELLKKAAVAGGIGLGAYEADPEHYQRDAAIAALGLGLGRGASSILRSQALTNAMIRSGTGAPSVGNKLQNLITRAAPAGALITRGTNSAPGQ